MKKCSKCQILKESNEFYSSTNNKTSGYCKECSKAHKKEHYQLNKSSYKNSNLKWRKWLIDLKTNLKCEKCGYNKSPAALDFHHIDPNTKLFSINQVGCVGKSKEEINKEINKCVVWCSNCHREYHAECY